MSRILHGPSPEIRGVRCVARSKEGVPYGAKAFHSMGLEGALSEEEIAQKISEARAEGYREAESKSTGPVRAAIENVEKILDELSQFRRELFKESEEDLLELVRTVSKRILLKEVSLNPELMKEIVAKALGHLEKQKTISLQLNASDFEFYNIAKADFLNRFKGIEELEIVVDPDVPSGSVTVRSKSIELDVKLEAMVDHLMNQVQRTKVEVNKTNDPGDLV